MPIETEPDDLRIETGRTWRDLPSEPPTTTPDRPRMSPPPPTEPAGRSFPWRRIGIGALALAIGVAVGAWAPWAEVGFDDSAPLAADELPETIVPETPRELVPEPDSPDEPFFADPERFEIPEEFFDQLPDGFFEGVPGATADDAGLIELEGLPDGYQERSNVYSRSGDRASQRIRLLGPEGPIDVQAIAGPEVTLPDGGEPFRVEGSEGRLVESDDSITISWFAGPDLLITVESTAGTDRETLAAVAQAVEVRP